MVESTFESATKIIVDLTEKLPIRVLHVDDEAGFLRVARQCLEMQGAFEVDTALSVREAAEKMKKKTYDAVVSDYMMPEKDGIQFLKELRRKGNNIPFVMFTGKGREEVAIKALNLGADRYLNKHGDPEAVYGELAYSVRQAVERARAQVAIKRSEEKFRSLFENARDVVVLMDLKGNVSAINKAAVEYGFKQDEVVGKNMRKFVPKRYWPKLLKELVQLARRKKIEGKIEIDTPKGKKQAEYRSNPIIIDDKVVGVQTILTDVTELKQAEEVVEESEQKLRDVIDTSPDGVAWIDTAGKITLVNRKLLEVTGSSKKDLVDKNFMDVEGLTQESKERIMENFRKRIKGIDTPSYEVELVTKNKEIVPAELSASLIYKGDKIIGTQAILRDITKRKKAEEALRESEEKFRSIFSTMPDGVTLVGLDGRILDCNDKILRLYGVSRDECLGRNVYDFIVPEDRERAIQQGPEVLEKGSVRSEVKSLGKQGRTFDAEINVSLLMDASGKPMAFLGVTRDITERKKAEEELRDATEKWGSLTKNTNDIIRIVDCKGVIQYINKTIPPYTPEETIGKTLYEYTPREQHDVMRESLAKVFKTGKPNSYEISSNIPETGTIWFSTKIVPIQHDKEIASAILISTDITERKRAEEQLRLFSKFIDVSPDGVAMVNPEGMITYANEAFVSMFGYSREELMGKPLTFIYPEDQMPKLKEAVETGMEDCWKGEMVAKRKNGERFPVLISASQIVDDKGKVIAHMASHKDITERKKAEERIAQSEQKYRSLVEMAPDGVVTADMKGVITSVNIAFARLTGYSKDEIVGKHFTKLQTIRARDIPKFLKLMGPALRGKKIPPFEYAYVRKDGTTRWGEAHVGRLKKDGKTIGFQAVLREITERKQAEKAIRESQEKFEQLFMGNPEAAVYVDNDFHVLDVNPRFTELFGYSLDEVQGKHINTVVVPEDKMLEAEDFDKKSREGYVYHDTVRKRKDGSLVPVSISAAPIILDGRRVGHVGTYKDISQLKKTEKELRDTLEKVQVLNEKLGVVGRLTRHDVRNKLSAVTGNVFLAKQKLSDGHEALKHLEEIESAVGQTVRIFDFARTYELLGIEKLAYLDVEKTVGGAAVLFSDLHGVKVVNDCHGLKVLADSLLRQLFYNLIDNSLKYGEKVSRIKVYYEEAGKDRLKLVYEDDGIGIPKAEKEKIFNEGYGKNTGYGLYLIRKMCEVYGWTIQETGKQGKGAEFTITIPKTRGKGKILYKLQK